MLLKVEQIWCSLLVVCTKNKLGEQKRAKNYREQMSTVIFNIDKQYGVQ